MENLPDKNDLGSLVIYQDCGGSLPPLARKGVELFNSGHYFDAHEELEEAWREETGSIRELYQGILQVAVAYYHIRNQNWIGAHKVLLRSRRWLARFPNVCQGVQVEQLRQDAAAVEIILNALINGNRVQMDLTLLKPLQFN
jgi:uncharacterized protein